MSNHTELINVVLAREKGAPQYHFSKDKAYAPDIDLLVISSPGEYNLGCSIVSCGDIARNSALFHTSKTKVADFQIAVLVN